MPDKMPDKVRFPLDISGIVWYNGMINRRYTTMPKQTDAERKAARKETVRIYDASDKGKTAHLRWRQSPKGRTTTYKASKRHYEKLQTEIRRLGRLQWHLTELNYQAKLRKQTLAMLKELEKEENSHE